MALTLPEANGLIMEATRSYNQRLRYLDGLRQALGERTPGECGWTQAQSLPQALLIMESINKAMVSVNESIETAEAMVAYRSKQGADLSRADEEYSAKINDVAEKIRAQQKGIV